MTVADLELKKDLNKDDKNYKFLVELLQMFEFEKLTEAFQMLDGVSPVIDSFVKEEMTKRKLKDLQATFL